MLHPKGMGLLEIKLKKFRLLSIPFTQIRPFIYGDFSLKDVKGMTSNCMCISSILYCDASPVRRDGAVSTIAEI